MTVCPMCNKVIYMTGSFNTAFEPIYHCPSCGYTTYIPLIVSSTSKEKDNKCMKKEEIWG